VSNNPNVFAFVGEKISADHFNPYEGTDQIPFDAGYKCKYKVIQWVYGKLPQDTVEFEAYTHKGSLVFDTYEHAMLFLSKSDDKLYQEKYQFFDVYLTKSGRWASCGDPYSYERRVGKGVPIVRLEVDTPYCNSGVYVEDLFRIKRDGVLMARDLFQVLSTPTTPKSGQ
jgi:hypothetical protein